MIQFLISPLKPSSHVYVILLCSDNGRHFVGAAEELKLLLVFLEAEITQERISHFCSTQKMEWKFIPSRSPHMGRLWKAAVKSFESHLHKVAGGVKLNYEKMSTVLTQIESCLNSHPLTAVIQEDDGVKALTPGHFIIARPLEVLPDSSHHITSLSLSVASLVFVSSSTLTLGFGG